MCFFICANFIELYKGSKKSKMEIYKCPKLKKLSNYILQKKQHNLVYYYFGGSEATFAYLHANFPIRAQYTFFIHSNIF
jgi:hypothetical protein